MSQKLHQSVLLEEVIEQLNIKPNGVYVDGTFGRGGHSQAILNRLGEKGRLIVMDKDQQAIDYGHQLLGEDPRVQFYHQDFKAMSALMTQLSLLGKVDGVLLDLGISSPQVDDPVRGFSFMKEGPLDMRMDKSQTLSAQQWLAKVSEPELVKVLFKFGEEPFAKQIARKLCRHREHTPIETTTELAQLIESVVKRRKNGKHPATKSFQAIRMFVNQELHALEDFLQSALSMLAQEGKLLIISFHSLEDRVVKNYFRKLNECPYPRKLPLPETKMPKPLVKIVKKITPSAQEKAHNRRARSAILRVAQRQGKLGNDSV